MSAKALRGTLRQLKREEKRLKNQQRRIAREKLAREDGGSSRGSDDKQQQQQQQPYNASLLDHLPRNRSLETSIGLMFSHGRDPRVLLDITQRLLGCTVLSLAANCAGGWDPFDVRPQVFALGKHMALPIFTSLPMLRQFCWKHDFSVRGPDNAVWAQAGCAPPDVAQLAAPPPAPAPEGKSAKKKKKKKLAQQQQQQEREHRKEARAALEHAKVLEAASAVEQFEMRTVSPLHTWGAPRAPFFYGYYGLLTTVFENASILPGETDIIVNPASPLELALSHGLTSQHFSRNAAELLVHNAFIRVEKKLRTEFASFLSRFCPEVRTARSVCLRRNFGIDDAEAAAPPLDESRFLESNGLTTPVAPELLQPNAFDIVILVDTASFRKTAAAIQRAKQSGALVGHAALRLLPEPDAPPHVQELAEIFYTKEKKTRQQLLGESFDHADGLELAGDSVIVNAHTPSDSFYSNPALAYSEAHAMALKRKLH